MSPMVYETCVKSGILDTLQKGILVVIWVKRFKSEMTVEI